MRCTNKYLLLTLVATSIVTTSCGKKDQAETKTPETQVVAKVNDDEISVHQVNFQLARMGQVSEAQTKEASKQILTRLVDQQLLKQQALEAKLDRDPRILQALESSKSEILAQAYLDQLMSKVAKPSKAEIDTFYKDHPELFSNRRIYRLQELVVDVSKENVSEIESGLKDIKSISEVAAWLKSKNYPFTANSNVRAAEQLPLEMLKKLQSLKDGELMMVPTGRSLNVLHLVASQLTPITRANAAPYIEQYFLNQNKSKLAKKEMEALNSKAKIEYLGAFADMKKSVTKASVSTDAKGEAALPMPEQITKSNPVVSQPNDAAAKASTEQSSIDKGLSGL